MPGHAYFSKIKHFSDAHYKVGELFFEYRKGSCVTSTEGKSFKVYTPTDCYQQRTCNYCVNLFVYSILDDNECDFCQEMAGRKLDPVRRPYPDRNKQGFHYCHVNTTPTDDRAVDDFQPRAQLRKLFNEGI